MNRNEDLSENINYQNLQIPILTSDEVLSDIPAFRELCHWHKELEFIMVLEGNMDFSVNNQVFTLTPNKGVFINSNRLHFGYSESKSECIFILIILGTEFIENAFNKNFLEEIMSDKNLDFYVFHRGALLWNVLERIHKINSEKEKFYELEIQSELCSAIKQLSIYRNESEKTQLKEITVLKQMMLFIHKNYHQRITLDEISSAGTVCRTRCCEIFKKNMILSPMQYLTNYRISKSIELTPSPKTKQIPLEK